MYNLEAHHHPPTETSAHPLSNIFIAPAFWFFLHVGLFNFLFIGPCAAPPTNILAFILIGASWRSSYALRKSIFHAKRWWIHLLFYFIIFITWKANSQFFFLWTNFTLGYPWALLIFYYNEILTAHFLKSFLLFSYSFSWRKKWGWLLDKAEVALLPIFAI